MKEPTTPEEVLDFHKVLRSDPQHYLSIVNQWIQSNPNNPQAYFDRHFAWMKIGEPVRALEDLNKVVELSAEPVAFHFRGEVYRHLGEYHKALSDFDRAEALNPTQWDEAGFGLLYQADCHARLGDEASALAHCARLPDDFWTPGVNGAPSGDKSQVSEQLRRIAADAQRRREG
jgi:tetratricopeptide (TPR) repeat protein